MAITEKYVSAAGSGTGLGTDESNQLSWTAMWVLVNAGTEAGSRFNVKGNVSPSASDTVTGDGTATSPVIIRGYTTTIGDGYLGRSAGGALNTANLPGIAYGATFGLLGTGSDFLIIQDLNFTGNRSGYIVTVGTDSHVINCKVANASTNVAAGGISLASNAGAEAVNCDVNTAASGGAAAILAVGSLQKVIGCRVTCPGAVGILTRSSAMLIGNTVYGCVTGISSDTTTANCLILNNTVYGCSGDGIDILTATTGRQTIIGNHITDNGGYGIDFNTSTCVKMLAFNRTRDNTAGAINPADDWTAGTTIAHVTTDAGAGETDYQSATDFALISSAAGLNRGPGYLNNIGANGDYPIAITVAESVFVAGGFSPVGYH